jgi:hypothetical protein
LIELKADSLVYAAHGAASIYGLLLLHSQLGYPKFRLRPISWPLKLPNHDLNYRISLIHFQPVMLSQTINMPRLLLLSRLITQTHA